MARRRGSKISSTSSSSRVTRSSSTMQGNIPTQFHISVIDAEIQEAGNNTEMTRNEAEASISNSANRIDDTDISTNLSGFGRPENLCRGYTHPKALRPYSGLPEDWHLYKGSLAFCSSEASDDKIQLDSQTRTWGDREDRFLYQILINSLDKPSIQMIAYQFENQGYNAYQYLNTTIAGSLHARYQETLDLNSTLKMSNVDDIEYYTSQLLKLERDLVFHKINTRDENGSIPSLILFSLHNLPERFNNWRANHHEYYKLHKHYPTVTKYVNDLKDEDRRLKSSNDSLIKGSLGNLPIHAFNTITPAISHNSFRGSTANTPAPSQSSRRGRGSQNRGSRGKFTTPNSVNKSDRSSIVVDGVTFYRSTQPAANGNGSRGRGRGWAPNRGRGNFRDKKYNNKQPRYNNRGGYRPSLNNLQEQQAVNNQESLHCIICNYTNHIASDCRRARCGNCWKISHVTSECPWSRK